MGLDFGPASYGISSVEAFLLNFQPTNSDSSYEGHGICPGTPITVSSPQLQYTARTELVLDQIPFANYRFDPSAQRVSVHSR